MVATAYSSSSLHRDFRGSLLTRRVKAHKYLSLSRYLLPFVGVLFVASLITAALLPTQALPATSSPVIGILSQPYKSSTGDDDKYIIAASYAKWLESAGARTILIPYDADDDLVDDIFSQVNGVLFTGGSSDIPNAAKRLWYLVKEANLKNNEFFPVWGTCLGFEYMIMMESDHGELAMESEFDSHNISYPLYGVRPVGLYSDPKIYSTAIHRNITMNNHDLGVSPARFAADRKLGGLFQMTSFNFDRTGRPFVSTMEPVDPDIFPVYGVQYHPEKNTFEYATYPDTNIPYEAIDHTQEGIAFSLYLAQFFVSLTRRNLRLGKHQYTKPYQYPLLSTYQIRSGIKFQQFYVFPAAQELNMALRTV